MNKHGFKIKMIVIVAILICFVGCVGFFKWRNEIIQFKQNVGFAVDIHQYDKMNNKNTYLIATIISLPKNVNVDQIKYEIKGYQDVGTINQSLTKNKQLTQEYLSDKILINDDQHTIIDYKIVQTDQSLDQLDMNMIAAITYKGSYFEIQGNIIGVI